MDVVNLKWAVLKSRWSGHGPDGLGVWLDTFVRQEQAESYARERALDCPGARFVVAPLMYSAIVPVAGVVEARVREVLQSPATVGQRVEGGSCTYAPHIDEVGQRVGR